MTTSYDPADPLAEIRAAGLRGPDVARTAAGLYVPVEPPAPDPETMSSEEYFAACVARMRGELLDTDGLDKIPALEPLLGDLLQLNTTARFIGPSGTFKSFLILDMAAHIGNGMPWHGHYVRQGRVIYLVAEGEQGVRKRVRAWEQHYGMRMDNVLFLPRPVQAKSPEWHVFTELARQMQPTFVVIDTQARVSVGVEENSNKEMGEVVDRMDDLRRATGACIGLTHHTGHMGDHGRGASSVKGAMQSEINISKKGDRISNITLTVKSSKQKDEEEGNDLLFGLKRITLDGEAKPDGRPVTSLVVQALDAMPERGPEEGSVEWIAQRLDAAGVPADYGRRRLAEECQRLGFKARAEKLTEVARLRKDGSRDRFPRVTPLTVPEDGTEPDETADQTGSEPPTEPVGTAPHAPVVPSSFLRREPAGPRGPVCIECGNPLDATWAEQGHDRHVTC
ncbi:AAA family ATPase [Streptomyces sp. NPDC102383]|uniref:AAA family ATPase n=1 Tax=Streptomyces sp. NPDC102383 TaxID=3366165 RepID=UPI0037F805E7